MKRRFQLIQNKLLTKKSKAKTKGNENSGKFRKLKWCGSLKLFTDALQAINEDQQKRELVEEAGFGSLFNLAYFDLPEYLRYFLVENYNPMKGMIKSEDGCVLDINEKDVEICLGIPRGRVEVAKIDHTILYDVVVDWRKHIGGKNCMKLGIVMS